MYPPPGPCTMAIGLRPTQVVFDTDSVEVLMVLIEPEF